MGPRETALEFTTTVQECEVCQGPIRPFARTRNRGRALCYQRCRRCGLVQMSPRPTEGAIQDFYQRGYRELHHASETPTDANLADQAARAHHLASFVDHPVARHLDIGASSGSLLRQVGADEQVAVEPGDAHRSAATADGIEAHASLEDLVEAQPRPFDLISLSHVLEHVTEPVPFLGSVREMLAEDGRVLIEVPNLHGHRSYEVAHLFAFTPETLSSTLSAAGFEQVRARVHDEPTHGPGGPRFITVVARRGAVSAPEGRAGAAALTHARRAIGLAPQKLPLYRNRARRWIRRRRPGGPRLASR